MRQTEIIEWAMKAIIEERKTANIQEREELNEKLRELGYLFAVEEQRERK